MWVSRAWVIAVIVALSQYLKIYEHYNERLFQYCISWDDSNINLMDDREKIEVSTETNFIKKFVHSESLKENLNFT